MLISRKNSKNPQKPKHLGFIMMLTVLILNFQAAPEGGEQAVAPINHHDVAACFHGFHNMLSHTLGVHEHGVRVLVGNSQPLLLF